MTKASLFLLLSLLLIPAPARAADWEKDFYTLSQGFVVLGQVVDTAATQRCLGAGTCVELNKWLARSENPVVFGIEKGGIGGLQLWLTNKLENKWLAGAVNFGIGGAFLWAGIHNYRIVPH